MIRVVVLAVALALASCTSTPGVPSTTIDVVGAVLAQCKYQAEAAAIANLIAAATANPAIVGGVATVNAIAAAVCKSATAPAGTEAGRVPTVGGIPIPGHFVN